MDKRKVIVFDMDGVIFDSTRLVVDHLKTSYPGITNQQLNDLNKENFHEAISKLNVSKLEEAPEQKAARSKTYSESKARVPMYAGIKDLLEKLSGSYNLAINTSAYERNALPLLENNDITKYFAFIATAEITKSKIEKFKIIADKLSGDLSDLIFITDTVGDVREADAVGVRTILVTWGVHTEKDFDGLVPSNLVGIAHSAEELEEIIDKNI